MNPPAVPAIFHARHRSCVWVAGCLFLSGLALAQTPARTARVRALEALDKGHPEEAVAILEPQVEADPGAVELLDLLGRAYLKDGESARAIETAGRLLRAFPERHATRLWLAQLLEKLGRLPEAESHYLRLVEAPGGPEKVATLARLGLARVFIASGRFTEARDGLQPLLIAGESREAALLELRALEEEGRLDQAIETARLRLALLPQGGFRLAALLRRKGLESYRAGDPEEAKGALREAAALDPSPPVLQDLAAVLKAPAEREEAIQALRHAVTSEGPVEPAAPLLGQLLLECGRSAEALDLARSALKQSPGLRFAELLRLRALASQDREPEVARAVERLGREHGKDPEWATAVLAVVESLEKPDRSLESWMRAVPTPPPEARERFVRLLVKAGARALRAKEVPRGLDLCRRAFQLAPGDPHAQSALARAEIKAGNPEGALRALEPLVKAKEPSAEALEETARALRALGRFPEAIDHARRGLELEPDAGRLRRLYWLLLEDAGREQELRKALDPARRPKVDSDDARIAAGLLDRRRSQAPFREILHGWLARLPGDPALRRVEGRALRDEGRAARTGGDLARAIELYRASLELDPGAASPRRELFYFLREAGRMDEAIEALKEARRLDPDNVRGVTLLAQSLREKGRLEEVGEVLAAVAPSLSSDPFLRLEAARLDLARGDLGRAASRARAVASETSDAALALAARRVRADALTRAGRLAEALPVLEEIALAQPGDARVLGRLARIASQAGKEGWGVKVLEDLRARFPGSAVDSALATHYFEHGDLERARECLRRHLDRQPGDVDRWLLLGEVEEGRGDLPSAREAFLSAWSLAPENVKAGRGLAQMESELGNLAEALRVNDEVLSANPYCYSARLARIKVLAAMGDRDRAFLEWEDLRRTFPHEEEEILLAKAELLAGNGDYGQALDEIQKVLDGAEEGALTILLYHGVSPDFERGALPVPLFRDQMRALRDVGYVPVGLREVEAWRRGERRLPRRALLITFDDARLDTLLVADPILKEFGFRAAMFVPTGFVRDSRTFFMSWSDLRLLAASGRWEFGAHGNVSHKAIAIDSAGRLGNFLISRRWIGEEGRNETRAEMEARIREDHRLCQEKIERELGLKGVGTYAFPYGAQGDWEITNEPESYPLNVRLLGERYRVGFDQTLSGYNLRGQGVFLGRLAVPESWDGEKLVAHLQAHDPRSAARLQRAVILSWIGRYNECFRELDRASELGAPPSGVLQARANALYWQGDRAGAREAVQELLAIDPTDPRTLEIEEEVERPDRPAASVRLRYSRDRRDREVFQQMARGEISVLPRLRLHAEGGHGAYSEPGLRDIDAAIGEVGALASLQGPLELEAALGEHWFDGARDTIHYSGAVRYRGLDWLNLEGEAAGGPVQTLRAVLEGTRLDTQTLRAGLLFSPNDRVVLSYRHGFYSDGNLRDTARWEYSRRLLATPTFRLGYDGTFDDTREFSAAYYSPEELHLHRAFGRLEVSIADRLWLTARVGGGYGWEAGRGQPVADGSLQARWILGRRIELSSELSVFRNPRYWSSDIGLAFTYRF